MKPLKLLLLIPVLVVLYFVVEYLRPVRRKRKK